ncbi:hypothetical protein M2447_000199 [Ereboglobus sp. PH5-10]|uniref:hypothetical protein n=1 Tax=Ereboglobus sp. PH5-10 TaxID=2940629 RepID=UPI002404EF2E|nr:hypothetical protein [Ereboglobus sp. PH5-10]MDF9826123.1 hypothetical protein [Ereboglobus sp. PH5-10]
MKVSICKLACLAFFTLLHVAPMHSNDATVSMVLGPDTPEPLRTWLLTTGTKVSKNVTNTKDGTIIISVTLEMLSDMMKDYPYAETIPKVSISEKASIEIEVASNPSRYRIKLEAKTMDSVEFDEFTFTRPRWGIAPHGARIIIRDKNDKHIYLGDAGSYSSNFKISEVCVNPQAKWSLLDPKKPWVSEWFSINDLGDGIKRVTTEKDPKQWKDFKITFWIKINKKSPFILNGDSGWILTEKFNLDELMEANRTWEGEKGEVNRDESAMVSDAPDPTNYVNWEQTLLESVIQRNAKTEFEGNVRKNKLCFHATGSIMDGYRLPGLKQNEIALIENKKWEITNMFPTDPAPMGASKAYWDAVEKFSSEYNRLLYDYMNQRKTPEPASTGAKTLL